MPQEDVIVNQRNEEVLNINSIPIPEHLLNNGNLKVILDKNSVSCIQLFTTNNY
jgi:hypothetical protein